MSRRPDLETCSWCLDEVEDSTLTEQPDGARICTDCAALPKQAPRVGRRTKEA